MKKFTVVSVTPKGKLHIEKDFWGNVETKSISVKLNIELISNSNMDEFLDEEGELNHNMIAEYFIEKLLGEKL